MGYEQVNFKVNPDIHQRLRQLKERLEKARQRQVTFNELLLQLVDAYESQENDHD
jgi:hypothetical protein